MNAATVQPCLPAAADAAGTSSSSSAPSTAPVCRSSLVTVASTAPRDLAGVDVARAVTTCPVAAITPFRILPLRILPPGPSVARVVVGGLSDGARGSLVHTRRRIDPGPAANPMRKG